LFRPFSSLPCFGPTSGVFFGVRHGDSLLLSRSKPDKTEAAREMKLLQVDSTAATGKRRRK
jgi:hypothetical protein